MEWEIITKEIKGDDGQILTIETPEQIDKVGNIYQKNGGVIPKACQKCKKKFTGKFKTFPVTEAVPYYKCKDCNFENAGGDSALEHKLEKIDHSIKKITKDRIVTVEKKIVGSIARITKLEDDVIILCDVCSNGS